MIFSDPVGRFSFVETWHLVGLSLALVGLALVALVSLTWVSLAWVWPGWL